MNGADNSQKTFALERESHTRSSFFAGMARSLPCMPNGA